MSTSTAIFTQPPNLASFTAPLKEFQESYDSSAGLIIGAFIFSYGHPSTGPAPVTTNAGAHPETPNPEPRLLLLHRASADAYGDLWDFPGGSVELSDSSIIDAVKREVMEETGLHVLENVEYVGMHTWIDSRPGRNDRKFAKFSFIVAVSEEGPSTVPEIKLAPLEHQAFTWAAEEDITASLEGRAGAKEFIDIGEIEMAAEAFRRFKGSRAG